MVVDSELSMPSSSRRLAIKPAPSAAEGAIVNATLFGHVDVSASVQVVLFLSTNHLRLISRFKIFPSATDFTEGKQFPE